MADKRLLHEALKSPSMWLAFLKFALSRSLHREHVCIRRDGLTLEVGTGGGQGGWCAIAGLGYEPELPVWVRAIQRGDVIIDIGANVGTFALRAAQKAGPDGKVIGFEPMPATADRLRRNAQLNGVANLEVIQSAVGAQAGEVELHWAGHEGSASILRQTEQPGITVSVVTLDDELPRRNVQRVDWIKMDIEGAEPQALDGMHETLRRFRPRILFENGVSGLETCERLRALDYEIGRLSLDGSWSVANEGINLFARPALG